MKVRNVNELLDSWRASALLGRKIAATYPAGHVQHACLLSKVGALEDCAKDLDAALSVGGLGFSQSRMSSAIEAVEAGLKVTQRTLPPDKKAALVMAAYELIGDEDETKWAARAAL